MLRALRNSWRLLGLAFRFARHDALFPLETLGIAPALIAWARLFRSRRDRRRPGERLAAAFEHIHMLVYHPRDAKAVSLQAMLDAGWSTTDVVTLSQLVSFLAFQIRVVAGLKALAARPR